MISTLIAASCPARIGHAQRVTGGRISRLIPFAGVLIGWGQRNRVYRNAEDFIRDRKQYYDSLRDTAREQLIRRQQLGLRTSQVAAYTKVVALIEQQRQTELNVAEGRKREARAAFHDRVQEALVYALLGSQGAQQVIDSLRTGVGSATQALDRAISKIATGDTGVLQDIRRVRQIAGQLSAVAGAVGGETGSRLREFSDRLARTIDQSQAAVRSALEQMRGDLRNMDEVLKALKDVGRTPTAGEAIELAVARHLPGNDNSGNASAEAVASILSKLQVGDGSLKDEARKAIEAGFVARCAELAATYRALLEELKKSGQEPPGGSPVKPGCRRLTGADLLKELDQLIAEKPPVTEELPQPPELEVLPRVTASGQYSETVSGGLGPTPAMGSTFQLTADFAAGTIAISLSGGRTVAGVREACADPGNLSVDFDAILVDYTDAYTAQASGALDPETGQFSLPFAPRGATTDRKTTLFTVEGCSDLNNMPAPSSHAYASTEGLITGYVTRDGAIEFSTSWSHCGNAHMQGGWSGYGAVSVP